MPESREMSLIEYIGVLPNGHRAYREYEKLRLGREKLWSLLDQISTLDDACKENDSKFRPLAYRLAEQRNEIGQSLDGQTITWKD